MTILSYRNTPFLHPASTNSLLLAGSPEARRTPNDAASRPSTQAWHSKREKGRRRCQRQGRCRQEHHRRFVLSYLSYEIRRVATFSPKVNLAFSLAAHHRAR